MPFGIGVEKMISARIVLVDALFDEPHPEDAGVEIEILLSRPGDGGDVMESGNGLHRLAKIRQTRLIARAKKRIFSA